MLSITSTAASDLPLSPVSTRFPLGLGTYACPASAEAPSDTGVRPFGLRFAVAADRRAAETLPPWRYCPQRQIAVVDDGTGEAWFRRMEAGTGSKSTTGASPDGGPSTGNEEWTPDFMGDASA